MGIPRNCRVRCRVRATLDARTGRNRLPPLFCDLPKMNTPPRGHPPVRAKGPFRPSNTNTRGKSDFDVFALLSGDATLIQELVSGHKAIGLHQALYLTQLSELHIALRTDHSRFPAVDSLCLCAPLSPLRRFRPCRSPSVRSAHPFASHRSFATLIATAL